MSDDIHLDRLRLPLNHPILPRERRRPTAPKKSTPFLKGPVSMTWLRAAAGLPGKALYVGVEIWFQVGLKRNRQVALSLSQFEKAKVSRFAASRGLAKLEEAGLVSVIRNPGRKPVVTVLHGPEPSSQILG